MGDVSNDTIFLFVYGTLKRGEPGHELMVKARFVATVMKTHLRWVREAEYPSCLECDEASNFVVGEIWEVPVADLPLLDEYEGDNYIRKILRNSNLFAYLLKEKEADEYIEIS